MTKLCYFQFYPGDWLKDLELRVCSHFARGLLVDLLCAMFEAKHRGRLVRFDGVTPLSDEQVVSLSPGGSDSQKLAALAELLENGVLKRDDVGVIYSARMMRDEEIRQARGAAGSKGGSKTQANLKQSDKQTIKQTTKQIPEDEYEYATDSDSPSKEECEEEVKQSTRFVPPTVDEVAVFCQERTNNIDPESFVSFYESKGWKIGKNSMKDWRAAVRTWERNGYGSGKPPPRRPHGVPDESTPF